MRKACPNRPYEGLGGLEDEHVAQIARQADSGTTAYV